MTLWAPEGANPEVAEVVLGWLEAGSWGASRTYLESHAEVLLGDAATGVLQRLVEEHPGQEVLDLHLELLEAARVGGIDAAFEAIDESVRRFALAEQLVAWVSTDSWDEARAFYDRHAELLDSDEAESVLDELVDDNPGQPDMMAQQGLLTLIRLDGADAAFGLLDDTDQLGDLVLSPANREDGQRAIPRALLLAGLFPDNVGAQLALVTTALAMGAPQLAMRAIAGCAQSLPGPARDQLAAALKNLSLTQPALADGLTKLLGSL